MEYRMLTNQFPNFSCLYESRKDASNKNIVKSSKTKMQGSLNRYLKEPKLGPGNKINYSMKPCCCYLCDK